VAWSNFGSWGTGSNGRSGEPFPPPEGIEVEQETAAKGHVWTALAAQEDSGADAARSGADMCPACSARHPRPLALMRSADRVPINLTGFVTRPLKRDVPILGHEPNFPSAPFTPRDRRSPLSLTLLRQSAKSYTALALSSPPRRYGRVCWRALRKPTGMGGGLAAPEPRPKVGRAYPIRGA